MLRRRTSSMDSSSEDEPLIMGQGIRVRHLQIPSYRVFALLGILFWTIVLAVAWCVPFIIYELGKLRIALSPVRVHVIDNNMAAVAGHSEVGKMESKSLAGCHLCRFFSTTLAKKKTT